MDTVFRALPPVTLVNTLTGATHRVWFENPVVSKPQVWAFSLDHYAIFPCIICNTP